MDIAERHPDDLRYYSILSGRHNIIWTLGHPDKLDPDRISSGWLLADALCHPDDLPGIGISSGWVAVKSWCHPDDPDDILFHLMSSGWLNWGWYLIRISYGSVIMSSGWDTLPILCHPDETANFDFPQHAVALQCVRRQQLMHTQTWDFVRLLFWFAGQTAQFAKTDPFSPAYASLRDRLVCCVKILQTRK